MGWLGMEIPLPVDFVRQRVGVRAIMNKLIFTKQGKGSLQKLLGMFGERSTSLGSDIVAGLLNPMREARAPDGGNLPNAPTEQ